MNLNPLFCTETGYTTQGQKKFEFQLSLRISTTQILLVQGLCILSKFMIYLDDDLPRSLFIAGISMDEKLPAK